MNFLFSNNFELGVYLDGQETRKKTEVKVDDVKKESQYVFYDGETVSGKVNLTFKKAGTRLDHQGIKIEFIGQIELFNDKNNRHEFTSLVRELANPGELIQNTSFPFEFIQVEKPYETYSGTNAKLSYFLRITVVKRLSDVIKEIPLTVHTLAQYPETNTSIKMEVGIEDCLHIEFEYNKSKYYLKDVIVGKIYFILVRLKIKHMDLQIIKRESVGSETNSLVDNEVITKFEIMDGLPVRGESIPIRLFLSGYELTPSMKDINKKFSVRYYINLVLVDEEDRRYFKQQEITLFRKLERQKRVVAAKSVMPVLSIKHNNNTDATNNNNNNNKDNNNNNNNNNQDKDLGGERNGGIDDDNVNNSNKNKIKSDDNDDDEEEEEEEDEVRKGIKNIDAGEESQKVNNNNIDNNNNNDNITDPLNQTNVKNDENNINNKENNNKNNNNNENNNKDGGVAKASPTTIFSNNDDDL